MNEAILGNDSKNFVTYCFEACGVTLDLPVLEYTLWNTTSYKDPNVLITDSHFFVSIDIGSASCVHSSSFVYFLYPRRSLGVVVTILIAV